MQGRCERHAFERAVDICGRCGLEFCSECVVYSFGQHKPPFCIPCATVASGLRSSASRSDVVLSRREYKQLTRERKRLLREHGTMFPHRATAAPAPAVATDDWFAATDATG